MARYLFEDTGAASLPASGVTAGSYLNANITVNSQGIVVAAADGASGAASLGNLTDVILTGPIATQMLSFDGTDWRNITLNIADVNDVTITAASTGDFLTYDGVGWVNSTISALTVGDIGTLVQAWNAELDSISGLTGTGYIAHTASGVVAERTFLGTDGINVNNGNGVGGNTEISVAIGTLPFTAPVNPAADLLMFYNADVNQNEQISIQDAVLSATPIIDAINVGAGADVFKGINAQVLEFRELSALGLGVTITESTNDIQIAVSTELQNLAALTPDNDSFIVGNGVTWEVQNATTVGTTLGLGTMAFETAIDYLPVAGGVMTGTIDMTANQINDLADPTSPQDAATKIYVDNAITTFAGSAPFGMNDLSDVDTTGLITGDFLVYNGISGNWEPQAGGGGGGGINNVVEDLTPQLGGTLDAQGAFKVSNLVDPTLNQDAATKIYVDQSITDLIASAPATLDTLNELAAALGDDPNFATTVTTLIGEKVAKAGDTMTGPLVLSGNPTLALHAASKQYVDSVAGETNTMANIAGGVGVFKQKIGVNFEMHPITGTGGTTVTLVGDVITVDSTDGTLTQIDTGDGISGGPITTTGTIALDINGLSVAGAVDKANDTIAIYDTSAGGVRKVLLSSLGAGDLVAVNNLSELSATQVTARANIGAASAADLTSHTTNTSNPHSVTAAQTGAVAKIGDSMSGPLVFTAGASLTSGTGVDLNIAAFAGQKTNIEGGSVEIQGNNGTGGQLLLNVDGSIQLRPATGTDLTLGDDIVIPFSIGTTGQILQVNATGTALEFATPSGGGGTATVERFRAVYNGFGQLSSIDSATSGINSTAIVGGTDVDVTFTGYSYPPTSIMTYGYNNTFDEYLINHVTSAFGTRKIDANGGAAFGTLTSTEIFTLSLTTGNTGALNSQHVWVVLMFAG